jgi:hypothetical protein
MRATLPASLTERAGIYELHWAVMRDGRAVGVSQAMLSVERSLFPSRRRTLREPGGSLTLGEIRLAIMDDPASNLLLDDVEFTDAQILQAIAAPVRKWNEEPPPIRRFSTRDFPFRGAWLVGVRGELHEMAATGYRRNFLPATAGGVSVPDKGKEREYLAEAARLKDEYFAWLQRKKYEINIKLVYSDVPSVYSATWNGW